MTDGHLLQIRSLTAIQRPTGVQISVGKGHDFRSENLTEAEVMRLVAVLRLAASDA